jgi:hypothetical protein
VCGLLAGLVWWLAWRRGCGALFLHLGCAAIVIALGLLLFASGTPAVGSSPEVSSISGERRVYALSAFAVAAYFTATAIARRNRIEGLLALVALAGGVLLATWRVVPADRAVAVITIFWFWFSALHLAARPSTPQLATCLTYSLLATLAFGSHEPSLALIWSHAAVVPLILFALSHLLRRGDYAILGGVALAVPLGYQGLRAIALIRPSPAAIASISAFVLLLAGGCVSWFKPRSSGRPVEVDPRSDGCVL